VGTASALLQPWQIDDENEAIEVDSDSEDACFVCGDGGQLLICDDDKCGKVYHLACVKLRDMPPGSWFCPRHFCSDCGEVSKANHCTKCPTSYCAKHVPEQLESQSSQIKKVDFKCSACFAKDRACLAPNQYAFVHDLITMLNEVQYVASDSEDDVVRPPEKKRRKKVKASEGLANLYRSVVARGGISKFFRSSIDSDNVHKTST
jgi:hypothetical protein